MKIGVYKQAHKGARWKCIGAVEASMIGAWPFKVAMSFRDFNLRPRWPRYQYSPRELEQETLGGVR